MGIKMVSPKGMNFTLISKKPIPSPVSKGEFVPILPKLIPAPLSGNFMTTITSAGIGPIRTEAAPPPKIIKVSTGESVFKTFIGATVITQKPMPQLLPAQHVQILSHTSPNMVRPVTIKAIPNTHVPQTMTITKGPPPQQQQHTTISVADSSKITISKEVRIAFLLIFLFL